MKKFYYFLLLLCLSLKPGFINAQTELWGVTAAGGDGFGSLFKVTTGSAGFSLQRNFDGASGSSPQHTKLIQASNGKIYGTLISGGFNNLGVLFEYDIATGIFTKKHDFSSPTGSSPRGPLMQASNGKLYGMTQGGGANNVGVLYEYDIATSTYTVKVNHVTANGSQPFGTLTELSPSNGKLYGLTRVGGNNSGGVIFEYDLALGSYTKKIDMSASTGTLCFGELVQAGSMLYGLAAAGGTNSGGTLFEYDYTNNICTKKFDLGGSNGSAPNGSLYKAADGNLYGMTTGGGANNSGVIFQYSVSANTYSVIHSFTSTTGSAPSGNVIQGSNGKLYGMGRTGGANGNGVIFEYDLSTFTYTKKIDLQSNTTIGGNPFGTLLQASNGKFYGLTNTGGVAGLGVLYEYDLSTGYTKKINLNYAVDGATANGGLVYAGNGKIYGTAISGGTANVGVIFEYDKSTSTYTKKIDMNATNGSVPYGSMVELNGKLYGLTNAGGANGLGVLYEYDYSTNIYTKKVDLSSTLGSQPFGNMVLAGNGKLYGLTRAGGTNGLGVIFEYNTVTATYTKKIDLISASGGQPSGEMVEAPNGKLYGMTQTGGANALGVIFEYDPSTNLYTKKIDLNSTFGSQPLGSLVLADDGMLYGYTRQGGANSVGTLIQYDYVNNVVTKKVDLSSVLGSSPQGSLFKAASGLLYGLTQTGGAEGVGALLEYNVTTSTITKLMDLSPATGCSPGYTRLLEICNKPNAPGLVSATTNSLCQGSTVTPSFSIAAVATATSYAWALPVGAVITGGSLTNNIAVSYSAVANGVYTYSVGATNACGTGSITTDSFTIVSNPTVTASNGTICSGSTFTINPSGASSYTYSGGTNTVAPTSNTNYTVTGSSAGCLSNQAVVTVSVNNLPVVTASASTNSVCVGGAVTLNGGGANTYTWIASSGTATSNISFSPSATASYTVSGTSTAGCTSTNVAAVTVTVNALPTVSVNSGAICSGNSFTIIPSGANTYTVQGGLSVVSPTANASFTVTGTSTAGCVSSAFATSNVSVNAVPTISVNSGAICSGNSFTITPSGASNYTLQGGFSVVSPTADASYTVTGTSTEGCVSSTFAVSNVTVDALPTISVNSGGICFGQSYTITPSGANTYTIQGGSAVVSPTANASYTVTGTSTAGCVSSTFATSNVTVNAIPTISVNSGAICSGKSFTITPSGASTYTLQGGFSVVSPTADASYTVTGTSTEGCVSSTFAVSNVTVDALPTISVNSGGICFGQSYTITPSGASTYTIQGGSVVVSPTTNASYTVAGTSTAGCVSSTFVTSNVTVNAIPIISVNNGTICSGKSFTIIPTGANTYTVQGGSSVVSPTANASYTVIGTSTAGCVSSTFANSGITVNAVPTISVNSGAICFGKSYTITPSGAANYTIQGGSAIVSPTANASFTVAGTNTLGCVSSTVVSTVTVNALPTVSGSSSSSLICIGETATLTGSGANTYTWSNTATTTVIAVSPIVNTTYTVVGTGSNGCVKSAVITQSVDACTSLKSLFFSPDSEVSVYPNPFSNKITVSSNGSSQTIQIFNTLGSLVYNITIKDEETEIDLLQQPNGIYFMKIGSVTKKIIKE